MHFAPPTPGLHLPCTVSNFMAIPAVTANPHTRYRGDPALTKRFYGFDSRLVLDPVIPKMLKMGVVPARMVLMMKWGPRNITGRPGVSIM